MNRNYNKKTNDKKPLAGFYLGVILGLIGILTVMPFLLPIFIIVALFIVYFKRAKVKGSFNSDNAVNIIKTNGEVEKFDSIDYKNKTDAQKRLESLKGLYENGFMEKDEYEETRKKYM